MEAGLAVVFIEAPLSAQKTTRVPQYMLDQCAAQGISPSGVRFHSDLYQEKVTEGISYVYRTLQGRTARRTCAVSL